MVARSAPSVILGFYTLSSSSIEFDSLPDDLNKKLPPNRAIPATLLGQLAIDVSVQNRGLGSMLLYDAIKNAKTSSKNVATYALVTDPIDEAAERFYMGKNFCKLKKSGPPPHH